MKRDLDSIILTRQELLIMKVVWELGSATVKEVCNTISRQKATAYTTVLTLMGILEEKGVLVHQRCGRAYNYKPLISREQATRNHVRDLIVRFFDGKPEKLIQAVLETEQLGAEQISQVAALVKPREQRQTA